MAEIDQSVRIRAFLNTWFTLLAVGLLLASAGLGYWAYQVNMVPEVQQEERLVEEWTESTSYNHSAEITNDSLVFSQGETVSNRPLYYTRLSEELDGDHTYRYNADSGDVSVQTETYLLIRGGELEDEEMTQTYWEYTQPLDSDMREGLPPGEAYTTQFTADIQFVLETIATVEEQLGASEGLIDVRVVTVSQIDGTVEGESVSETYESEMVMVVEPATFRVINTNVVDEQHQTFQETEVIVDPSPLESFGSIALAGLAVALLVVLVAGRYAGYTDLTEDEQEVLRLEQARDRFSEWITTGTFPSEREYEQTILVDDLEGLVDVAIDTNKRVIEDEQLGVSTVLDDNYIYIYVRPDSPARDWLLNYADTTLDESDRYEF